jgi:hypothetical protein
LSFQTVEREIFATGISQAMLALFGCVSVFFAMINVYTPNDNDISTFKMHREG